MPAENAGNNSPLVKNLFNPAALQRMASRIQSVHPTFPAVHFVARAGERLPELEFKGRLLWTAEVLRETLPDDYPQAVDILVAALTTDDGAGPMNGNGLLALTAGSFVELYGLEHFNESLRAMHLITQRSTAEFAIRPYLMQHTEQTLAMLEHWAHDENEHVRRLVSEGTRPRLPWAARLPAFIADPTPTIRLLEKLKDDPAQYVRRSVANHLNDITKDHPERVLDLLENWAAGAGPERMWIIRHALRSLLKAGHPRALALLGYGRPQVALHDLQVGPDPLRMGQMLEISFVLANTGDKLQELMVDYIVHFVKASGRTSPKVFKLATRRLEPGQTAALRKSHSIRPISTRRYYGGQHRVEIQVNGQVLGGEPFTLLLDETAG